MIALLLTGLAAVIMPFMGRLLWEEFVAWHPVWCAALIRTALRIAPKNLRERLAEEWQSYLDETPGYVRKLWNAVGFVRAARKLPSIERKSVLDTSARHQRIIRSVDFSITLLAVITIAPCLLIITLLIRLTSRGPALYRQPCIGEGGRIFYAYRFRTMRLGQKGKFGSFTAIGRYMHATSVDQLPELFNVLKGEMSLVGPKPLMLGHLVDQEFDFVAYGRQSPGLFSREISHIHGLGYLRRLPAMYRLYRRRKTLGLYMLILMAQLIAGIRFMSY